MCFQNNQKNENVDDYNELKEIKTNDWSVDLSLA